MDKVRPTEIRAHDDGVDAWEMVSAAPAPELAGLVDGYCAYRERIGSFAARRELAATSGVLIFVLGDPLLITDARGREIRLEAGDAFLGGIADATSISRALGPQQGIHVFMPLASLAAICGVPVAALANVCVPFADLAGADARDLGHALGVAASDEARFALLDRFLIRRLAPARALDPAVRWAATQLLGEAPPSVSALADEIGWSRKHLTARFGDLIGITPGRFAQLRRFERFTEAIIARPGDDLAGLAVECGYYDQAHLARDVRAFSDMTPGELRARVIPAGGGVRED